MCMTNKLYDVDKINKIVADFKTKDKPTKAGLLLSLGVCERTLYNYIDRDDEIGQLLKEALLYIAFKHEERLFDKANLGSIFWLKCNRKLISFNDHDYEKYEKLTQPVITFNVIEKEKSS